MISVVRSAGATVANKALCLWVQSEAGFLVDVFEASFRILNSADTQVYPVSGAQTIDVGGAPHLGLGCYAAVWAPDGSADLGRYTVRWSYRLTSASAVVTFDQEFELVAQAYRGPHYCSVYDLRAEGFTTTMLTDAKAQTLITLASRYVEHFTGRRFDHAYKVALFNGRGGRALQFDEPVVAVEALRISYGGNFVSGSETVESEYFKVFNRHITQQLSQPDDRGDPKLEFLHGWDVAGTYSTDRATRFSDLLFPRGVQNIEVTGLFGYTEYDGSHVGQTPDMVRQACKLLCYKNLYGIASSDRENVQRRWRLTEERTRDQSYILAKPLAGALTGDMEVDSILAEFVRPPQFGAA